MFGKKKGPGRSDPRPWRERASESYEAVERQRSEEETQAAREQIDRARLLSQKVFDMVPDTIAPRDVYGASWSGDTGLVLDYGDLRLWADTWSIEVAGKNEWCGMPNWSVELPCSRCDGWAWVRGRVGSLPDLGRLLANLKEYPPICRTCEVQERQLDHELTAP